MEYYIIKADTSSYVTNLQVHYLGEELLIKISAYLYNDYGMFEGKIIGISDVSIQKDGYGNVYVAKVKMDNPQELSLSVGMSGSAEIVIGTRSALEYFLEPVTQGVNESFREK